MESNPPTAFLLPREARLLISMKPVIVGLACLLSCIITHASTLTHAQQIAKENGITLYNQYKTAEPELRIAAEAGDRAMSST